MVKATRKMMLKLTLEQEIELQKIYRGAIKDLSTEIEKEETLTQLWLKDYRNALIDTSNKLAMDLTKKIYDSAEKSAKYGAYADTKLFEVLQTEDDVHLPPEVTGMFTSVPDEVLRTMIAGDIYRDGRSLSDRVWRCRNDFNESIDYVLKKGISVKKSSYELAKDLEQFVKEPSKRAWDWGNVYPLMRGKQIDFNAQRLARTTITHAYREAQYRAAARNPFVTAIHWELSAEHYVRQVARWGEDECDVYAEQDWYELGTGNFPADEVPIGHPQCLCYTYGVIPQSLDEIADELIAWGEGEDNIMGKEGRRFLPNLKKLGSPRLNLNE